MLEAVRIIRRAGRAFFEEMFVLFLLNILTALSLFLLIPFPPALFGLWAVARRVAEDRVVHPRDGWAAMKRYFWPAWRWALLNLAVVGLTLYNIRFYATRADLLFPQASWLSDAFQGALGALLVFWAAWQLYVLPLMVDEEQPGVVRALRRSLALLAAHPAFSLTIFGLIVLLFALSTVAFGLGFFVAPGAVAVLTTVAARHLLGRDDPEP